MILRRSLSGVPVEMRPMLRNLIEKLEADRSNDLQIEAAQMLLGLEQMLMLRQSEIDGLKFQLEKSELWNSACTLAVDNMKNQRDQAEARYAGVVTRMAAEWNKP